jgi:hypothetical protein
VGDIPLTPVPEFSWSLGLPRAFIA